MQRQWTLGLALIGMIALVGCGGGGGVGGGSSRVAVLVTDSFREDYDHVWATLYKIELVAEGGGTVILFADPAGRQMDLHELRDAAGAIYAYLGEAGLPAGTYTSVRVVLGDQMRLFAPGSGTGSSFTLDSTLPRDADSHVVLTHTFTAPKTFTSSTPLVLDFDLANFIIRSGQIVPVLKEASGSGLTNPERHLHEDYHGTISGLTGTAPEQSFTLNRGNGMNLAIVTTAATAIYGSGGSLTNGRVVEVRGRYNPTTQRLVATAIEVKGAGEDDPSESVGLHRPEVHGDAAALNATAGTFTVTILQARGFVPSLRTVNVVTTAATEYRTDGGRNKDKAAFFTALALTPSVEVDGTYDPATNTLTARRCKIDDNSNDGGWEDSHHHDGDDRNDDGKVDDKDDDNGGHGGDG